MEPPQFALPLNESREIGGTLAAGSPPGFRHMTPFSGWWSGYLPPKFDVATVSTNEYV